MTPGGRPSKPVGERKKPFSISITDQEKAEFERAWKKAQPKGEPPLGRWIAEEALNTIRKQ